MSNSNYIPTEADERDSWDRQTLRDAAIRFLQRIETGEIDLAARELHQVLDAYLHAPKMSRSKRIARHFTAELMAQCQRGR